MISACPLRANIDETVLPVIIAEQGVGTEGEIRLAS